MEGDSSLVDGGTDCGLAVKAQELYDIMRGRRDYFLCLRAGLFKSPELPDAPDSGDAGFGEI